jgi:hypothetical protein
LELYLERGHHMAEMISRGVEQVSPVSNASGCLFVADAMILWLMNDFDWLPMIMMYVINKERQKNLVVRMLPGSYSFLVPYDLFSFHSPNSGLVPPFFQ